MEDRNGNDLDFLYDSNDRLTRITDGYGRTIYLGWSGSRIRSITESNGDTRRWRFSYDDISLRSVTSPDGKSQKYAYDADDRLVSIINEGEVELTVAYHKSGAVSEIQVPSVAVNQQFDFDFPNRTTTVTETVGAGTQTIYDAFERLSRVTGSCCGYDTQYEYDGFNNITKVTDANGNATTYRYDLIGNLLVEKDPLGDSLIYTYDPTYSRVASITDKGGNVTSYTYDGAGNLIRTDHPLGFSEYYSYDAIGRVTAWANGNDDTTTYTYDMANRKVTMNYPSGETFVRNYDHRTRLTSIIEGANTHVTQTYNLADVATARSYLNGASSAFTRNDNNWATQITHSSGGAFWDVKYTYDQVGNRTLTERLHRTANSEEYTYDNASRLTSFETGTVVANTISSPTSTKSYSLDDVGNRTAYNDNGSLTTYTANNMNEYSAITTGGTVNPTYDANGNQTADGSGSRFYFYDYENRLIKVSSDAPGTTVIAEYLYDPMGRRIRKAVGVDTTEYYYADEHVIEERTSTDTTLFVFGDDTDQCFLMKRGSNNWYYHYDALGSVVSITNSGGTVVEQYEYDAYGAVTRYNASFVVQSSSSTGNPFYFTGRRLDEETGLYYYRARHYEPTSGRYLQRDPQGYIDGMNLYAYVNNNPINRIDPFGLHQFSSEEVSGTNTESNNAGTPIYRWKFKFNCRIKGPAANCNKLCKMWVFIHINLSIEASGTTPAAKRADAAKVKALAASWKKGIQKIWDKTACLKPTKKGKCWECEGKNESCCECDRIDLRIRPIFYLPGSHLGSSVQDQDVNVKQGNGRANMTTWYSTDNGQVAAHEFGHMMGVYDEYADPAVPGRTLHNDGSIMASVAANAKAKKRHFKKLKAKGSKAMKKCPYDIKMKN